MVDSDNYKFFPREAACPLCIMSCQVALDRAANQRDIQMERSHCKNFPTYSHTPIVGRKRPKRRILGSPDKVGHNVQAPVEYIMKTEQLSGASSDNRARTKWWIFPSAEKAGGVQSRRMAMGWSALCPLVPPLHHQPLLFVLILTS